MVKLRDVPDSPEQKLPNCPFATESQTFPDSNSSWMTPSSSQGLSSPEPTEEGIIMVTPPDSEGSFDQNAPREDDKYQTPPEQYYSFATDSEDANQPPPPPVTTVCGGDDVQPMAVDLKEDEGSPGVEGSDGKKLSIQLLPPPAISEGDRDNGDETMIAVEEGNLGLLRLELGQSSRGSGGDCVIRDDEMKVLPCELKKAGVLEGELSENAAKKIRFCEGNGVRGGVYSSGNEEKCGKISKGENLIRDGEGENLSQKITKDSTGGNVGRNEIVLDGGGRDGKGEILGKNCENSKGNKSRKNGKSIKGEQSSDNRRGSDSISRGKRVHSNDKEGAEFKKDSLNKSGNGASASRAPEKLESLRESVLKKAFETIGNYKHASSSGAMEQRGKQKSVLGKCEAPSPKIGGKNAVQKEVPGGTDGIKGGSLKDILGKLELVMEKPKPKDSSEPDFFEKAKQQGVVFPRPRWWPPEGTDDDFQMA